MLEQRLDQDLKTALLAGDKMTVSVLRGLKSSILYAKVANGSRDQLMSDDVLVLLLKKEAAKRQESADLYQKGNNEEKAQAELAEKQVIDHYLPVQLSEAEIAKLVEGAIHELNANGQVAMGLVIARVKQQTAGRADGSVIARLTKEGLGL